MNEIWKFVKINHDYIISNLGNIRHISSDKNRNIYNNGYGYLTVKILNNKKYKNFYVHRLVAEAFIDNPDNLKEVNHKDCNTMNNNVENLEWCNHFENIAYANILGHMGKVNKNKFGKLHHNHKEVFQYDCNLNLIRKWDSIMDIERTLKIKSGHISECCNNKRKKVKGYIFKYYEI